MSACPAVRGKTCPRNVERIFVLRLRYQRRGETAFTRILATFLLPTGGTARVLGFDVATQAGQVRAHIGVIFAGERGLYWRLSGRGNMEYFAALYHVPPNVARRRIPELLELVGLADRVAERAGGVVVQAYLAQARGRGVDPWFLFPPPVQPVIFACTAAVLFQRTPAHHFMLFGVIGSGLVGLWNDNI